MINKTSTEISCYVKVSIVLIGRAATQSVGTERYHNMYVPNHLATDTSAYVAGERAGVWREMQGSRPRGSVVLLQLLLTKSRRRASSKHSVLTVNCMCQDSPCRTQTFCQRIYALVSSQNFRVTAVISRLCRYECFQRGGPARDPTIKFEELSGVTGGWRETDTATMHT
jgi:hypothetical protein